MIQIFKNLFLIDLKIETIRTPVLIVYGDEDPLVAKEHIVEIEKYIPDSIVHKFIGGSHNCHQEFSAEFKKMVENFLCRGKRRR